MKEINIWEIEGFNIGNAQNSEAGTGCTAIICKEGAFGGVSVKGSAPASRETELLNPLNTVEQIHCVMLSGGSAYGLAAGDGAMEYLEEKNVGFDVGVGVVPIVCGASLFDLILGDPKVRPDKEMGYLACVNSEINRPKQGNFGAGTGATVGKYLGPDRLMKGGLGTYAIQVGNVKLGAIVGVNCLGDVFDQDGKMLAGILNEDKNTLGSTLEIMTNEIEKYRNVFSGNTTIACVITNAKLSKVQANKIAAVAHNGFAKAINPVHTSVDGDTIFVMANGQVEASSDTLGALATEVVSKAIINGVKNAETSHGVLASKDII